MKEKTLRVLEYSKIIEKLKNKSQSNLGKEKINKLKPEKDIESILKLQKETTEAVEILISQGMPPLYGIFDLSKDVRRAEIGGVLIPQSLLNIGDSLRVSRDLKSFLKKMESNTRLNTSIINFKIDKLVTLKSLEMEISRCIVNSQEISDNASKRLKTIRQQMKNKNDAIKSKLNGVIRSSKYDKYLQDSIVTVREGRYVVPIKQENKRFFPGLVHDQSASGATLFVEPMAIVELNNELKKLEIEENKEIERILEELSKLVADNGEFLLENQKILLELDFIFAKGNLSLEMKASEPLLNNKGYINLKSARHPLLNEKDVIPIDIYIGDKFNSLVITGPNTGGKTVTLKTVGLLTLMAQTGLHIPADSNSEIGVFNNIFADIGDEQSIEQNLSTFSSHMTNIVDILEEVDYNSLVLFDELGAGTDPTEGAALAMSILDHLLNKNIRTLATTHYSQLKVYALTKDRVKNASVEFDIETLRPTYKLLIGVPGKSNAFEISKKLGLQDFIIKDAKKLISNENVEFEDVLTAIDKDRRIIEEDRYEIQKLREEITILKDTLNKEKDKTKISREKILRDAKEEARDILKRAKFESDEILRDIKDTKNIIDKDYRSIINQSRHSLSKKIDEIQEDLSKEVLDKKVSEPPKNLKLGETVEVLSLNQKGTVLTLPDSNGDLSVQVGIMKVNVNIKNICRAKSENENKTYSSTKKIIKSKKSISNEIDLRGLNLEEAIFVLDKYIDDAYIARLSEAYVIHGKGTGVLRKGINSYLKKNKFVLEYRLGGFSEGGHGVTVISIK